MSIAKKIASKLPDHWQSELKRFYFKRQICKGTFVSFEPEYNILSKMINDGDWVIDVGANIGHYTKRFSELVGANGRVIAFEPVPTTFALLAANVQLFSTLNVTLVNAAVSDATDVVGMSIPFFSTGLTNYYQAHITNTSKQNLNVMTLSLDSLAITRRIKVVKIDAEGHEVHVLKGMKRILQEYHPTLIIETDSNEVITELSAMGYRHEKLIESPNILFTYDS